MSKGVRLSQTVLWYRRCRRRADADAYL